MVLLFHPPHTFPLPRPPPITSSRSPKHMTPPLSFSSHLPPCPPPPDGFLRSPKHMAPPLSSSFHLSPSPPPPDYFLQVTQHYDLMTDFKVPVPELQYAAYCTMDSDNLLLRDAMWNADSGREALVRRFENDMDTQVESLNKEVRGGVGCGFSISAWPAPLLSPMPLTLLCPALSCPSPHPPTSVPPPLPPAPPFCSALQAGGQLPAGPPPFRPFGHPLSPTSLPTRPCRWWTFACLPSMT